MNITDEEMEWLKSTDALAIGPGAFFLVPKWMSMERAGELLKMARML
jgi:hypothetical protein